MHYQIKIPFKMLSNNVIHSKSLFLFYIRINILYYITIINIIVIYIKVKISNN